MTLNLSSLGSLLGGSNSYNPYSSSLGALDYSSSLYDDDSSLASLYGGTDYANRGYSSNTLNTRLARENAYLKAQLLEYKDAAENRKGLFGGPVIGANEKGNGGIDIFSGLAGFLLPKLLGGGKNKDNDGGGFLGGLFG
ncbi:MAG: hypothetical protein ACK551_03245 [Vampirovibrionales bacterium]